eukprot:scaffold15011_cov33-Tisochrysis_lutea.AAC.4
MPRQRDPGTAPSPPSCRRGSLHPWSTALRLSPPCRQRCAGAKAALGVRWHRRAQARLRP